MRLNDSEWIIMRALWKGSPATAREVHDRLAAETEWAYTTVRTLLARLVEKGVVEEVEGRGAGEYVPRLTQRRARASALRSLIERAFDGTFGTLVQHMVREERLSAREREELRSLLDEADGAEGGGATEARTRRSAPRRKRRPRR